MIACAMSHFSSLLGLSWLKTQHVKWQSQQRISCWQSQSDNKTNFTNLVRKENAINTKLNM